MDLTVTELLLNIVFPKNTQTARGWKSQRPSTYESIYDYNRFWPIKPAAYSLALDKGPLA